MHYIRRKLQTVKGFFGNLRGTIVLSVWAGSKMLLFGPIVLIGMGLSELWEICIFLAYRYKYDPEYLGPVVVKSMFMERRLLNMCNDIMLNRFMAEMEIARDLDRGSELTNDTNRYVYEYRNDPEFIVSIISRRGVQVHVRVASRNRRVHRLISKAIRKSETRTRSVARRLFDDLVAPRHTSRHS